MKKINKENEYTFELIKDPHSFISNEYRKLQLNIEFKEKEEKFQVIQIVSANPSEGKTSTVINLANAYKEKKKKVLIMDLDLRKPKIHRAFDILNENGLNEFFKEKITFDTLIKKTVVDIDVIVRGEKVTYPNLLLESKQLLSLVHQLREMYDIILVDCPPILTISDALLIKEFCDACLFVCAHRRTKKEEVKKSFKILKNGNVNIIGNVITFKELKGRRYEYKYYDE